MTRLAAPLVIATLGMLSGPALALGETPSQPRLLSTEALKLTGTPVAGHSLSCSQGTWSTDTSSYTYTWLRDGNAIAGQTAGTYTVQKADWGHSISCQVTTSNPGGEYTIQGLPSGSYHLTFEASSEVGDFLSEYYDDTSLSSEATPVSVTAPDVTSGVDAALPVGGQIAGTVTAATGGAGLAGIEVCAHEMYGFGACATTNAGGEYTIQRLSSGTYNVEFSASTCGERRCTQQNYLDESDSGVLVATGSTTSGINAALPAGGQITGKATSAGGAGLSNIEVCTGPTSGPRGCTTTNASGEYTISGLRTGIYDEIQFSRGYDGGNFLPRSDSGVSVTAGSVTPGVNAQMQPGGEITGVVTAHSGGAVLANIEACVVEPPAAIELELLCTITNGDGEYTLPGLPTGSYDVEFHAPVNGDPEAATEVEAGSHPFEFNGIYEGGNYAPEPYDANPVSVTAGSTTSGIDAEMSPGGQITGKVTAASGGATLPGIEVCTIGPRGGLSACATTNGAGEYTISDLSSGTYDVEFFRREESGNYLRQSDEGVSVTAGSTPAVADAAMPPGGQITGSVTASSGGAPLANIRVCASNGTAGGCATTNAASVASATSSPLAVPAPDSNFSMVKAPVFDAKTGDLDLYLKTANAGTLRWQLSFKNSDVAFADSLGLGLSGAIADDLKHLDLAVSETAKKKSKGCKAGFTKHKGRCVHVTVPFADGSTNVPAGTIEIKVHVGAKALKALKAGHALHVSGPLTFQSALGGAAVVHVESAVVRWPKKHRRATNPRKHKPHRSPAS